MNALLKGTMVPLIIGVLLTAGCGAKKEESSRAAINKANEMETVEEKTNYLVGQAQAFYKSKDYKDAIELSQHVLNKLDAESKAAMKVMNNAKEQLAAMAENAKSDLKNKMGL